MFKVPVEIYDEIGVQLVEAIRNQYPELDITFVAGQHSEVKYETIHPQLLIPSRNPRVPEPLAITLGYTFEMFWHRGYFFDFPCRPGEIVHEILHFLNEFFIERILYTLWTDEGETVRGGPQWPEDDWRQSRDWKIDVELLEIRTWLGNKDCDVRLIAGDEDWGMYLLHPDENRLPIL